jgi:hypothetical protein
LPKLAVFLALAVYPLEALALAVLFVVALCGRVYLFAFGFVEVGGPT